VALADKPQPAIDLFRARIGDEDDLNAEELADECPRTFEPWRALDGTNGEGLIPP
jgi:hypothetical protein